MIQALSELPVTAEERLHKDISLHVKNNFLPSALQQNPGNVTQVLQKAKKKWIRQIGRCSQLLFCRKQTASIPPRVATDGLKTPKCG